MRVLCYKLNWSKALEFRVLWLLKKALPLREEPDNSLSIVNCKVCFHLAHDACIIRPKALNTRSNDFIRRYIERVTSRKRNNHFMSRCEG